MKASINKYFECQVRVAFMFRVRKRRTGKIDTANFSPHRSRWNMRHDDNSALFSADKATSVYHVMINAHHKSSSLELSNI